MASMHPTHLSRYLVPMPLATVNTLNQHLMSTLNAVSPPARGTLSRITLLIVYMRPKSSLIYLGQDLLLLNWVVAALYRQRASSRTCT